MGPDGVDQLAPLSAMFSQIYAISRPERVLMLGCGTGNGLEHIDPATTRSVVAVDIHAEYLGVARSRHAHLEGILQTICARAEDCRFDPGSFDLVHGGLFFEYVDPRPMVMTLADWLAAGGMLGAVVQLPSASQASVSPSRFASIALLKDAMRLVAPDQFEGAALDAGLRLVRRWIRRVAHGKAFTGMIFRR